MKKIYALSFLALLYGVQALAADGKLSIQINQRDGDPEHISGVAITIDNLLLPSGNPLNTSDNDVTGTLTFPLELNSDKAAFLSLEVKNQITSGHKVPSGMALTLILSDGSKLLLGTTSNLVSESQFEYSEGLTLSPGVELKASPDVTGPVVATYFRNALDFCIRQNVRSVSKTVILSVGQNNFSQTSSSVENVGNEVIDPIAGERGLGGCKK